MSMSKQARLMEELRWAERLGEPGPKRRLFNSERARIAAALAAARERRRRRLSIVLWLVIVVLSTVILALIFARCFGH